MKQDGKHGAHTSQAHKGQDTSLHQLTKFVGYFREEWGMVED